MDLDESLGHLRHRLNAENVIPTAAAVPGAAAPDTGPPVLNLFDAPADELEQLCHDKRELTWKLIDVQVKLVFERDNSFAEPF